MDERQDSNSIVTPEMDLLANKLMVKLGFKWNDLQRRWYPGFNALTQSEVISALLELEEHECECC